MIKRSKYLILLKITICKVYFLPNMTCISSTDVSKNCKLSHSLSFELFSLFHQKSTESSLLTEYYLLLRTENLLLNGNNNSSFFEKTLKKNVTESVYIVISPKIEQNYFSHLFVYCIHWINIDEHVTCNCYCLQNRVEDWYHTTQCSTSRKTRKYTSLVLVRFNLLSRTTHSDTLTH